MIIIETAKATSMETMGNPASSTLSTHDTVLEENVPPPNESSDTN